MPTPAQFTTVTTEGGLLPSDLISRLVNDTRSLPGTREEDYWITPGRQLREIINRSWNDMLGAWQVFQPQVARLSPDDHTATLTWDRWLLPLFAELGYGRLERFPAITVGDKEYPISHHHEQALVHLVGWNVRLDRRTAGVVGAAKAAPHSMVQELLNRTDKHLWAIISNGRQLRILRDNSSLTRSAYVEFDLEQMFSEGIFTDFVALWLLVHASRIEGDPQSECWLEQWANEARQQGVRALDFLGQGFEDAIETLGQGFLAHPANFALRDRLRDGHLSKQDYYRQLLRLVYRLVFLLVAEDRSLLHSPDASPEAKDRYARYYSLSRIRDLARRRRGTKHSDLWDQIAVVAQALGPDGQPALGLPALGSGLWAPDGTADLNAARLSNSYFLAAVRSVAYLQQDQALHRIDYRNLGSEELGSVYESLLELHPDVDQSVGRFSLVHAAGNERKTTGSFYTPTSLISALLDSALDPVLSEAEAKPKPEDALLELKVLDPACGSGHFLVAAAQRIARRLAVMRTGETDPTPDAFRHALRQVIGRCIFGVDLNPMAVELCKVSLWLESVEPGRPLSFLDHHIVCGNSFIGASSEDIEAGIPDGAYKPLIGDDKAIASSQRKRNSAERSGQGALPLWGHAPTDDKLARSMAKIDELDDGDLKGVNAKQATWQSVLGSDSMARTRFAADAWCTAFVIPKAADMVEVTTSTIWRALDQGLVSIDPLVIESVRQAAEEYRFLHFHVAFPQVFSPVNIADTNERRNRKGFDAVIGNPPWEKIKLSEKEFFAAQAPHIADEVGVARKRKIASLKQTDPHLFGSFQGAQHRAEAESSFLRSSGRFPLCGRGDVNTYAVFAELMCSVMAPTGRMGVIVPTGIVTDDTTKDFFGQAMKSLRLASALSFENEEHIFAGVHNAVKFCLLTIVGSDRTVSEAEFLFFARRSADLSDPDRRYNLTISDLQLLNPNTLTAPIFRSRRDAQITKDIYTRIPILLREGTLPDNPWAIQYLRMFDMSNDSHLFRREKDLLEHSGVRDGRSWQCEGEIWLPLYEAKMAHHFNHRWGDHSMNTKGDRSGRLPPVPVEYLSDPNYCVTPQYWVRESDIADREQWKRQWMIGFRGIARSVDVRTLIAFVVPRSGAAGKMPLITPQDGRVEAAACLPALLSSFVADYVARQKVGGSDLTWFGLKQLAIPSPDALESTCEWSDRESVIDWLVPRLLELTYTAWDLKGYAIDLGYDGPPFLWDEERRSVLRAELDACFFHLYGTGRDDVEYIMGTFPIVQRKDQAAHGEYRTARLILERYDAMAQAIETGSRYQGGLE